MELLGRFGTNVSLWLGTAPPPNAIAIALDRVGVPTLLPPADSRDPIAWAAAFLDTASELEHALMVEYLYAAYSAADPTVTQTIAGVAAQEMGHLATVQNLRLAVGLDPYLGRQDQAPQPGQDPFPFKREPLSLQSLAKYAAAERPDTQDVPADLKAVVAEIMKKAEEAVGDAIPRVGLIYAFLYWIFLGTAPADARPWPDFPEDKFRATGVPQLTALSGAADTFQAEPVEWRAGSRGLHVVVCSDGRAAVEAIYKVAAQGEGLADDPDSHFLAFVNLYRQMADRGLQVHKVPVDPHAGGGRPESLVTHPASLAVSAVLDAAYAAMQIEILVTFHLDRAGPKGGIRRQLATHLLSDVMQGVIGPLARLLCSTLPQVAGQADDDPRRAGAILTPPSVTGGSLTNLLAAWGAAIDALQAAAETAAMETDPNGDLVGILGTVQETVDTKRTLLRRIGAR